MTSAQEAAKKALDKVIKKSRIHFYKPIQIAEILFKVRTGAEIDLRDLDTYRNESKHWRDEVSQRLVGRVSSSSQRYQDDVFNANAVPPKHLVTLAELNDARDGLVEAYIYKKIQAKFERLQTAHDYIQDADVSTFQFDDFLNHFVKVPGLKRSVDKMYEIVAYALFINLVNALGVEVDLERRQAEQEITENFLEFSKKVLGLDAERTSRKEAGAVYRVGVTNAADRGLDMWTNFGPAIQVKHLDLTSLEAEKILEGIQADRIIIVCLDTNEAAVRAGLQNAGLEDRLQAIVTVADLRDWYRECFSEAYGSNLGVKILTTLKEQFVTEFPSVSELQPFIGERGYDAISLRHPWNPQ